MDRPAGPDPLALDLRIEHKGAGLVIDSVAQLDRIRQRFVAEAEP